MQVEAIKKWTILIFADGNNEMGSIMNKSLHLSENTGSNSDVNVVFQIGMLGQGVRRYYVSKDSSILIEDLGKSNMADPNNLYDFIKWGFESFKAEHYMLVLSDHGGDFVGCFTDESLDKPYIMGIPEMIAAVNGIKKNLNYDIDILVLDMCYMNSIEVIYEFGHGGASAMSIITYMDYACFDGINYEKLIYSTEKYCRISDFNLFIKNLIDSLDFDLMAIKINSSKLKEVKDIISDAALQYRLSNVTKNPLDVINQITPDSIQPDYINSINNLFGSMIIHSKKIFKGLNISINITAKDVGQLIAFYDKLAFSKENYFTELLCSSPIRKQTRDISKVNVLLFNCSIPVTHHLLTFNK